MDVSKYLEKKYEQNGCFDLVCDVYRNELGITLPEYHADIRMSAREYAMLFRLAIHNKELHAERLDKPEDMCVVTLGRSNTASHCGVYYQGSVLHTLSSMTAFQPMFMIEDTYKTIEYWRYRDGED